jgi:hypothetical protein
MLRAIVLMAAVGIVVASSQAADLRVTPAKPAQAPAACVEESLCEGACVNGKTCRIMTCLNKTWRWFGQTCGAGKTAKCGRHPRCP